MNLSTRVLGTHIAQQLEARATAPLLKIGADVFTRADLAHVACFNFQAAATLSRVLAEFRVRNTRDVYETVSPTDLAVPGLGAVALAVLGAAFEQKHLGGDAPLEAWVKKHRAEGERRELVTFGTIKQRAADDEARTRRERKRARRDQAHRLRVVRFTQRRAG